MGYPENWADRNVCPTLGNRPWFLDDRHSTDTAYFIHRSE
jgi:hypothetical protein